MAFNPFNWLLGLFSLDIGIDLGTANTLVYVKNKGIVINEPSWVTLDKRTREPQAVGLKAKEMMGRTAGNMIAVRPVRDGVISEFDVTEIMLTHFIALVHDQGIVPLPRPRVIIGIPAGVTEVEKRAVYDAAMSAGAREAHLIEEPIAAALGAGLPVNEVRGSMVVDIGGGTSDLAVFSEGILKHTAVIPFGGENITNDIRTGLGVLKIQAEQMKVQFGSALSDEAKSNAFITIPGLRGMAPKEISVKNLAGIIQARMSEIMDFVSYHLKQVGLDNRLLNGGVILTGGGSQLKHLIQLTEYVTGLNARIGYPNEHLAAGHIEELAKPMYSTCLGLILKGYNDYENKRKQFELQYTKVNIPAGLQQTGVDEIEADLTDHKNIVAKPRKTLKAFMDSFKNGLIEMFKEEGDAEL